MNSSNNPINQHSLKALESWLISLGAKKNMKNPSSWHLIFSNWSATIIFEQEDLSVIWEVDGKENKRLFSYCMNIKDVENAILQGP